MKPLFVLNGPNLNRLGKREPHIYGHTTLAEIEGMCREAAGDRPVEFRQSNKESELIDWIHEAADEGAAGIVINPAAFTFTSMAIMDALKMFRWPDYRASHQQHSQARADLPQVLHVSSREGRDRGSRSGRLSGGREGDLRRGLVTFPVHSGAAPGRRPSILVGLLGTGIGASRTPALHEVEGQRQGLNYVYRLIDTAELSLGAADLPELLHAARRFGFAGLNVTHPYKQAVLPLLDELSPDAEELGAVNTLVFAGGKAVGHNTDWSGFAESFRRELSDTQHRHVVLIGAGGAGAAVGHALLKLGVETLSVVDTDAARAAALADGLQHRFGARRARADTLSAVAAADGVVNASPVGMAKYLGSPLPPDMLRPDLWVADIVYFPLETELLRTARARGCRTMAGGAMAVFQAVDAFRLFTGLEPEPERMLQHFRSM